eukprot:scaffold99105_cov60-Phaeocystis_antarctica.AAC.9
MPEARAAAPARSRRANIGRTLARYVLLFFDLKMGRDTSRTPHGATREMWKGLDQNTNFRKMAQQPLHSLPYPS